MTHDFWFEWSAIATILHRFRDRLLRQRLKIAQYRSSIWGRVRGDHRSNFVTANSCPKARIIGLSGGEVNSTISIYVEPFWFQSVRNRQKVGRTELLYQCRILPQKYYTYSWQRVRTHPTSLVCLCHCKERNVKKYIQWIKMLSLTIRVYLYSFSRFCISNLRNPWKCPINRTYNRSRSSMLVPIESACALCNFLSVINSNFGRITYSTVFEILTCKAIKRLVFPPLLCQLTPPLGRNLSAKTREMALPYCENLIILTSTVFDSSARETWQTDGRAMIYSMLFAVAGYL